MCRQSAATSNFCRSLLCDTHTHTHTHVLDPPIHTYMWRDTFSFATPKRITCSFHIPARVSVTHPHPQSRLESKKVSCGGLYWMSTLQAVYWMSTHVLCVCACHWDARRCVKRKCVSFRCFKSECVLDVYTFSFDIPARVSVTHTHPQSRLESKQVSCVGLYWMSTHSLLTHLKETHSLLTHLKETHSLLTHLRASQWHTHTHNTCVDIQCMCKHPRHILFWHN